MQSTLSLVCGKRNCIYVSVLECHSNVRDLCVKFTRCRHRRQSTLGGTTFLSEKRMKIKKMPEFYTILARKLSKYLNFYDICPKNRQNSRILHDFCPKNTRILHDNCPKNIFHDFFLGGGWHVPHPAPVFYACGCRMITNRCI